MAKFVCMAVSTSSRHIYIVADASYHVVLRCSYIKYHDCYVPPTPPPPPPPPPRPLFLPPCPLSPPAIPFSLFTCCRYCCCCACVVVVVVVVVVVFSYLYFPITVQTTAYSASAVAGALTVGSHHVSRRCPLQHSLQTVEYHNDSCLYFKQTVSFLGGWGVGGEGVCLFVSCFRCCCFSISSYLAGTLGCLTWVKDSIRKSSATLSVCAVCSCVQTNVWLSVFGLLTCALMLVHATP